MAPRFTATLALVLAVGAGCGTPSGDAAGDPPPPAECPASVVPATARPSQTRDGALVTGRPSRALLCRYAATGATRPLTGTDEVDAGRVSAVVAALNALPAWEPASGEDGGCLLGEQAWYEIVVGYPDRPPAVLDVSPDCGVVSGGGAVRRMPSLTALLGLWA